MRFEEFAGGLKIPLSIEESHLVEKIEVSDAGYIDRDLLTSREIELARQLVSRGVLSRGKLGESSFYTINILDISWRD